MNGKSHQKYSYVEFVDSSRVELVFVFRDKIPTHFCVNSPLQISKSSLQCFTKYCIVSFPVFLSIFPDIFSPVSFCFINSEYDFIALFESM